MVMMPLLLGAGFGLAVWLCVRACWPQPSPVADVLAQMDRPGVSVDTSTAESGARTKAERLGRSLLGIVARLSSSEAIRPDLELVGRSPERHALDQLGCALFGTLFTALFVVGVNSSGALRLNPLYTVLLCGGALACGWGYPMLRLREEAQRRRRAFRHALSGYLDLVNILLAGGAGVETALWAAADVGEGWPWDRIRASLQRARLTRQTPWETFEQLGQDVKVVELSELAANVALAGSHGTRIRASLAAQADALRGRQIAETESAAEAATERMVIPVTVMLGGFFAFVAYPAVRIVTGAT
jgi:tight adherence protein C